MLCYTILYDTILCYAILYQAAQVEGQQADEGARGAAGLAERAAADRGVALLVLFVFRAALSFDFVISCCVLFVLNRGVALLS